MLFTVSKAAALAVVTCFASCPWPFKYPENEMRVDFGMDWTLSLQGALAVANDEQISRGIRRTYELTRVRDQSLL
jgi:hypothetical protein